MKITINLNYIVSNSIDYFLGVEYIFRLLGRKWPSLGTHNFQHVNTRRTAMGNTFAYSHHPLPPLDSPEPECYRIETVGIRYRDEYVFALMSRSYFLIEQFYMYILSSKTMPWRLCIKIDFQRVARVEEVVSVGVLYIFTAVSMSRLDTHTRSLALLFFFNISF